MSNSTKTFGSRKASKRSAFTLIELSIVLIIIGLLVAGVTGGASLIKSAQLRGVMSEARGYNVAVNAFVAKFDALPGDYNQAMDNPTAALSAVAGNADDVIDYISGTSTSVVEGINAWYHLLNSGTIDETLTAVGGISGQAAIGAITPGTQIPGSKLDETGWVFDNDDANDQGNVVVATGPIATVTPTASTEAEFTPTGAIVPVDALSIDSKMDDGAADAGEVRAFGGLTDCSSGSAYSTQNEDPECALSFTVDIS